MDELNALGVGEPEFFDLKAPWLYSPRWPDRTHGLLQLDSPRAPVASAGLHPLRPLATASSSSPSTGPASPAEPGTPAPRRSCAHPTVRRVSACPPRVRRPSGRHGRDGLDLDHGSRHREAGDEVLITGGDGDALLDALLALTDPGDEVVLTDPTYAGMLNRVHLAGAVPRLVPSVVRDGAWRLDLEALRAAVRPHTRALFVQNPTFPSGQLFDDEEWATIAQLCHQHDLWLICWALFEGVVYDGAPIVHPASLPGLRDRLVTIGSVSIEQRMIGWRLGWIVAPHTVLPDSSVVHIYNSIVPGGIAQASALAAYTAPDDGLAACVAEWQRRRDVMLEQLDGLPVIAAAGTWSQLLDVAKLEIDEAKFSRALLAHKWPLRR